MLRANKTKMRPTKYKCAINAGGKITFFAMKTIILGK